MSQAGKEPIMTKDQFAMGASYLRMFLKSIDVEVEGGKVKVTQNYDFGNETLAKSFAESLKKTFEEGL